MCRWGSKNDGWRRRLTAGVVERLIGPALKVREVLETRRFGDNRKDLLGRLGDRLFVGTMAIRYGDLDVEAVVSAV